MSQSRTSQKWRIDRQRYREELASRVGDVELADRAAAFIYKYAHKIDYAQRVEVLESVDAQTGEMVFAKSVRHVNTKDTINQTYAMWREMAEAKNRGDKAVYWKDGRGYTFFGFRELPKYRVYGHLAATHKDDYLWYVNAGCVEGESRDLLVMIDADWHDKLIEMYGDDSDAQAVAEYVAQRFGPSGAYIEPSTNGRGRHVYALLRFSLFDQFEKINAWINAYALEIGAEIQSLGFRTTCNEIKGTLPIRRKGVWVKSGSPAKMPHPLIPDAYSALLSLKPVDARSLGFDAFKAVPDASPAGAGREAGSGSKDNTEAEEQRTQDCVPLLRSAPSGPINLTALRGNPDTFDRANKAVVLFARLNPGAGLEDGWNWYCRSDLKIGNSDRRCWEDAWGYRQGRKQRSAFSVEQAEQLFEAMVQSESDLSYQDGKKTRFLAREKLIRAIHVMSTSLLKIHPEPQRQFTISREMARKEMGLVPREWLAVRSLLERWSLFSVLDKRYRVAGKAFGISKKYQILQNHPLYETFCQIKGQAEQRVPQDCVPLLSGGNPEI